MKKTLLIIFSLFSILIFSSCKEHKIKTMTEKLTGTWIGYIDDWCDTNNFNKVVLQLQENNIALLNYSGPDGDRWNTPYVCKWWLEIKRASNPYKLLSSKRKYYFLYISVDDTLCDPCHTPCGYFNCYSDWTFPDTVSYQITNFDENTVTLSKKEGFLISGSNDLLFSKWHGDWFGYYIKTLYKQN